MITRITGIDGRRLRLGAQPSSPVSPVVSVPFSTGPWPAVGLDYVCWGGDTGGGDTGPSIETSRAIVNTEARTVLLRGHARSGGAHSSCQLNDEPDEQSGDDEQQHFAHSRSRSPVTGGTSRLPITPPDVGLHVGDHRSVIRHRSAS
jgi:hypothetical protein